jgi:hypothetical protein
MEFLKLTGLMKKKKNFFMKCQNRWVSMFNLAKKVMAKMANNTLSIMFAKVNFEFLCDLNLFISLSYLLPMLETI